MEKKPMFKPTLATLFLIACAVFVTLQVGEVTAQENASATPAQQMPLISPSASSYNKTEKAWAILHERARIEADGRLLRSEFNKWVGHSPARPNMNASYLSNGSRLYYIPGRNQFVNAGAGRSWYW